MKTGEALIAQIDNTPILPNSLALWGLGQMGLIVKGPDAVIYLDPDLSYSIPERAFPPPLTPEQVTNADWVFISHEHLDHLDPDTIKPIAANLPTARFVLSGWCLEQMKGLGVERSRMIVPQTLQTTDLPDTTLDIIAIPAAHYQREEDPVKGNRWLGFWLMWNGVTLYFAGDTIIFDGYIEMLRTLPPADLAMLPVNGRDYFREQQDLTGNLHPREAAHLANEMQWSLVIAGHNDLVPSNVLPMSEIAQAFSDICPRQPYKILQPGELLYFMK